MHYRLSSAAWPALTRHWQGSDVPLSVLISHKYLPQSSDFQQIEPVLPVDTLSPDRPAHCPSLSDSSAFPTLQYSGQQESAHFYSLYTLHMFSQLENSLRRNKCQSTEIISVCSEYQTIISYVFKLSETYSLLKFCPSKL